MYAEIIIDITNEALDRAYTYHIPEGMDLHVGDRVTIPFGASNAEKTGYVVGLRENFDYDPSKVKDIAAVIPDAISVQEQLIHLAAWMSTEYGTTMNQCLKTVLPVRRTVRKNARRIDPIRMYQNEQDEYHDLNPAQAQAAAAVIAGYQACVAKRTASPVTSVSGDTETVASERSGTPSLAEAKAAGEAAPADGHTVPRYLLHGITGSGKTEVYLHIMEEVIRRGDQVILLIPEISLTYQTVRRVSTRFQGRVAILNSRMSIGERFEQYTKCERGEVNVLIGPRSAVFAPFERLGLIIMDEEHESAYKSETAPRYETRDVAYERARLAGCPVLYGSATPSLTIYSAALRGEVQLLELLERAHVGAQLAETEIIDLREELAKGNRSILSERLYTLMQEKLERKEQIMLFMNRRGYSNFVSCRSCGEALKCPHCDITLTLHRDGSLRCHYCGYQTRLMKLCPSCGSPYLAPFGFGTEKLESYVKKVFPTASVLRMDADTTKRKGDHERILEKFRKHQADILIGTQMIVKGHDFPDVTLVGLIAADLNLSAPDFKASERTFQLLTQAAGRAGRGAQAGTVIIQTYQPDHYAIVLSKRQDYKAFYEKEFRFRKLMGYPPTERLMTIQLASKDEDFLSMVSAAAAEGFQLDCSAEGAELIGPLEASVYRINDVYRKIVYIKHPSHDIIIRLRDRFTERVRQHDRRGLVLLNYDLQ